MNWSKLRVRKGQGLTEYGIILVLVAVGAITVFALFGKTIRQKVTQISAAISGDSTTYSAEQTGAKTTSAAAKTAGDTDQTMSGDDHLKTP